MASTSGAAADPAEKVWVVVTTLAAKAGLPVPDVTRIVDELNLETRHGAAKKAKDALAICAGRPNNHGKLACAMPNCIKPPRAEFDMDKSGGLRDHFGYCFAKEAKRRILVLGEPPSASASTAAAMAPQTAKRMRPGLDSATASPSKDPSKRARLGPDSDDEDHEDAATSRAAGERATTAGEEVPEAEQGSREGTPEPVARSQAGSPMEERSERSSAEDEPEPKEPTVGEEREIISTVHFETKRTWELGGCHFGTWIILLTFRL